MRPWVTIGAIWPSPRAQQSLQRAADRRESDRRLGTAFFVYPPFRPREPGARGGVEPVLEGGVLTLLSLVADQILALLADPVDGYLQSVLDRVLLFLGLPRGGNVGGLGITL